MKVISVRERAKPNSACVKLFNIIITLLTDPNKQNELWLELKRAYRHVALIVILYSSTQHFFNTFHS